MTNRSDTKSWKDFEVAVARLAQAIDPRAIVRHNVRLADRDMRRPRQRDVWIEARVCGIFPAAMLVSCKKWKRKIDSGHVDAFLGELDSSGAHIGVLFSRSGFTEPALEKAKARGVHCCRLYSNEAAELPDALRFQAYCCNTAIQLSVSPYPAAGWDLNTWGDILGIELPTTDGGCTLLIDALVERFDEAEAEAVSHRDKQNFPQDWPVALTIPSENSRSSLQVTLRGRWKIYAASIKAQLVSGTYLLTEGEFHGSQSTPWIDRFSAHPGPGWELLAERPATIGNTIVAILYKANTRQALLDNYAAQPL